MEELFLAHYEAKRLQGKITDKTSTADFINIADTYLCRWADTKDPEQAVKMMFSISDWLLKNGYDAESIGKEITNNELNKVLYCDYKS